MIEAKGSLTGEANVGVVVVGDAENVKFKDGTTLQEKFDSGELKGEKGQDGYTPQKGVDYFDGKDGTNGVDGNDYVLTSEDKQEIANIVLETFPNAEGVEY